jgi:tetratricopeptide (TPR) repeat protein
LQSKQDLFNINLGYGKLALARGDKAAAVERYRQALRIAQQITDEKEDVDPLLGMSISRAMAQVTAYRMIAEAQEPSEEDSPAAADWARARQSYTDAITLAQKALDVVPTNDAVAFEVWALQIAKGRAELHGGSVGGARAAYEEARRINDVLASGPQRNDAVIHEELASVAMAEKKWAVARAQYQAEFAIVQHHAELWPDNQDVQRMLAVSYYNLANVETMFPNANLARARALFRKSEQIGKWLEGQGLGRAELDKASAALADLGGP